jgi:hypothetical protein
MTATTLTFKHYLYCAALLLSISACKPTYNVLHVTGETSSKEQGVFYYLPKTTLVIDVEIIKTNYIPGPYAAYSEQYLGYTGIQQKSSLYEMRNIVMTDVAEPDENQLYYIETEKKFSSLFEMEENGLLRNVNIATTREEKLELKQEKDSQKNEGVEKQKLLNLINIREKLDTVYQRQIMEDSVIVEKRSINRILVKNSLEQSAREAAQKITEIRSSKYALISFNEDIAFESGTLNTMLKELNDLENEYFKLFLGYSETEKINHRFYYKPDIGNVGFQPLFKFNSNVGVTDSLKLMMETVYIVQTVNKTTQGINYFNINNKKLYDKKQKDSNVEDGGLAYRIPETATFKIIWNNKTLATANVQVAQFGTVLRLPKYNLKCLKLSYDVPSGYIKTLEILPKRYGRK